VNTLNQRLEHQRVRRDSAYADDQKSLYDCDFRNRCLRQMARYQYDAFGKEVVKTGDAADWNRFRYSTKWAERTHLWLDNYNYTANEAPGLVSDKDFSYYGYRYYSADEGRWLSRDPIGESGGRNLFGMVGNDGVNWVDILGLDRLVFDGKQLCRMSDDLKECNKCWDAVSGKDLDGNGKFDDFSEDDQKQQNRGPIPEGEYELPSSKVKDPSKDGNWNTDDWNDYEKNDGDGFKPWKTNVSPRGTGPWGDRFARLKPGKATNTHGRSNFNIHGGDEPGSAGCIDIGCNDKDFFDDVRKDAGGKPVRITVDYSGKSTKSCVDCKDRKDNPWP
jgi:RHS repeat-associated protein